jgi:hypothetical protein
MVLIAFSILALTSFFISCLIGIISKGRATYGVKYFPLLAGASMVGYFISKTFIETFLSGFAS